MTTKTVKKSPHVERIIRYRTGRKIIRELAAQGIVVELKDGRLKIWNASTDDDGEFLDTPDEAFNRVADHRDAVMEYLWHWERTIDKATRIWLQHDPEYRAMYGDPDEGREDIEH